jgi:hypothetical protein
MASSFQVLNVRDSPIDDPESVVAPALKVIYVEGCVGDLQEMERRRGADKVAAVSLGGLPSLG